MTVHKEEAEDTPNITIEPCRNEGSVHDGKKENIQRVSKKKIQL